MNKKLARHFSTEEEWAMWEAYRRYYRDKHYGDKHHENNGDRSIEHHIQRTLTSKQRKEAS